MKLDSIAMELREARANWQRLVAEYEALEEQADAKKRAASEAFRKVEEWRFALGQEAIKEPR